MNDYKTVGIKYFKCIFLSKSFQISSRKPLPIPRVSLLQGTEMFRHKLAVFAKTNCPSCPNNILYWSNDPKEITSGDKESLEKAVSSLWMESVQIQLWYILLFNVDSANFNVLHWWSQSSARQKSDLFFLLWPKRVTNLSE